MKHFVALLAMVFLTFTSVRAQNFLEHLQKNDAGKGVVTVKQSKEIDELVNGDVKKKTDTEANINKVKAPEKEKPAYDNATVAKERKKIATDKNTSVAEKHKNAVEKEHSSKTETEHKASATTKKQIPSESEAEKRHSETDTEDAVSSEPAVDLSKKVMRQSYRVTGYRVQLFAGGNSRADRQKAEGIGKSIKMKFPTEPVYVHFYSPRWTCRMGNYRSYGEANKILNEVKQLGYKQTTIVRGTITVQY